jgi:3'-phosphoadenosine 5'-phosphosulfate (PAPS) 3'-phosphatase
MSSVSLLDLAAACVACTEAASRAIQSISTSASKKNARLKEDGTCVTDADFAAQGIIVAAIRSVSHDIRICGEESAEEMAAHSEKHGAMEALELLPRTQYELRWRYHLRQAALAGGDGVLSTTAMHSVLPLAPTNDHDTEPTISPLPIPPDLLVNPEETMVDASRIGVVVDPLDGTNAYAQGEYDAVSILIGITLDDQPIFGVIGKPFGYPNLTSVLDRRCAIVYGGPLLQGVYMAGGREIVPAPLSTTPPPRAVISSSRSQGVVHDFCVHLADDHHLIHREPLYISGAGEKSLRLILQVHHEALWFFPKKGTCLWDVAAPDAILRALGGKLTDKWGQALDYSQPREAAENLQGIVACSHAALHAQCIALFQQGDWSSRI